MTDMKSGLRVLIGAALIGGTALVAGCGSSGTPTRTTTTEQTTTTTPAVPAVSTTTTTTTQQSRP
jgi:hypothetical protein